MSIIATIRRWLGMKPKGIDFCWPDAQIRIDQGCMMNMLGATQSPYPYYLGGLVNCYPRIAEQQMRAMQNMNPLSRPGDQIEIPKGTMLGFRFQNYIDIQRRLDAARERAENQAELDKLFPAGR